MNTVPKISGDATPRGDNRSELLMLVDLPVSSLPMSASDASEYGFIPMSKLHAPPSDAPAGYVRELMEAGVVRGDELWIRIAEWKRLRAQWLRRPSQPQPSVAAATVARIVARMTA